MRKKPFYFQALVLVMLTAFFISCSKDDDETPKFDVTQAQLDAVSQFIDDFTGGKGAHGGPDGTKPDSTVRSVYSNKSLTGSIEVGTIVTKKTWKKGKDGKKSDQLYVAFAMVKREAGYYKDGGDWEYCVMPMDPNNDYAAHPFGLLPSAESSNRGKLNDCASCHADAGEDFLFVN